MQRPITGFHPDAESDWVAELACGHGQHARHAPPFTERAWVLTQEGRASQLGSTLDCVLCDRGRIPDGHQPYRRTAEFSERSVPQAPTKNHSTKRGVWARIHVLDGELEYHVHAPFDRCERLTPASPGIVLPEVEHHVTPTGPVRFFVEFWRRP